MAAFKATRCRLPIRLLLTFFACSSMALGQMIVPLTLASGLDHPWAVAFLPGGAFLVSERPGALRIISATDAIAPRIEGLPKIAAGAQGGLLDVILDSDFEQNRTIYFCYSEPSSSKGTSSTALASAQLSSGLQRLEGLRVLFSQKPKVASQMHFGCRIVESKTADGKADGRLFLTLGERYDHRDDAQTLDNHHGKVIRINKDGSIPADNPFINRPGALPEIWSFGHRNPQGATISPKGVLWINEHGPRGGDEINLPLAGENFGWPLVSFGRNYNLTAVGTGKASMPGTQQPLHQWTPSIAPSGMAFVSSDKYGKDWVGNLLVGSLKFKHLVRLELQQAFDGKVVRETAYLASLNERIRDVRQGPDGYIYVLTDSSNGQLIRLVPARPFQ